MKYLYDSVEGINTERKFYHKQVKETSPDLVIQLTKFKN